MHGNAQNRWETIITSLKATCITQACTEGMAASFLTLQLEVPSRADCNTQNNKGLIRKAWS